jgi:hypothetical protein
MRRFLWSTASQNKDMYFQGTYRYLWMYATAAFWRQVGRGAQRHLMLSGLINIYLLTPWRQNPNVHHRVQKSPRPVHILSQLNPLHPQLIYLKIHSDPVLPYTPWSSEWPFSLVLPHQNLIHFYRFSHACRIPRPPHSSWFDMPNDIWGWVQIMKILTV